MADNNQLGYPYTKPRGPIGAMISSPGPIYMLPPLTGEVGHDFDSTQIKAPAYSFGKILQGLDFTKSPGPAAYEQNSKMTNIGDISGPKQTMAPRNEIDPKRIGPGPAKYNPNSDNVFPRQPQYQMGVRLDDHNKNSNPAPNAYTIPQPDIRSEKISAPKFTLGSRLDSLSTAKNPGPADYSVGTPDVIMNASPKYSMGATLTGIKSARTPGPDVYRTEDINLKRSAPKFTMGILHSPYKGEFNAKYYDDC